MIEFHPEARREIEEAVAYYDSCREGLGDEFIRAVEEALKRIRSFPDAWSKFSVNTRRCRTTRFPYGIIYQVTTEGAIRVIAVMHLHRKPNYWVDRIG